MSLRFNTEHQGDIISLTLFDSYDLTIWRVSMERFQANALVDLLYSADGYGMLHAQDYRISVNKEGIRDTIIYISDSYSMLFKVILNPEQVQDLASTLRIHVISSEEETRPKDIIPPLDDTLNTRWTPEGEREAFGDDYEDDDPSESWKRGQ